MDRWDLCLAWNWEFDAGFAEQLEKACSQQGLTMLQITHQNLEWALGGYSSAEIQWQVYFDRASDADPGFQPLADIALESHVHRINPHELAIWAQDKATMHLEFLTADLETPHTIILPPYHERPDLEGHDLSPLEGCFAIKPARGGGGEGVILEATNWDQVLYHRQQFPEEKYLLQAHITPHDIAGRPAWFRVLYCDGAVYPCWWDPKSHSYSKVTADERFQLGLSPLQQITRRIASLCRLDIFSTEIAMTKDGTFFIVDYVNDPVDLRLQSQAVDGVPDEIVANIAMRIALLTGRSKQQNKQ